MQLDYGISKPIGLAAMVQYARSQSDQNFERYLQKVRGTSFKSFVQHNNNLSSASNYGFAPVDCVRERIPWTTLRKRFTVKDLMQWGMTFETAVKIGLKPAHLGGDKGLEVLRDMEATDEQIKEFLFNFEALKSSKLSPAKLKEAGFSFADLVERGCSARNLRSMEGFDIKALVLAFEPTAEEWVSAGFTDAAVKEGGWDTSLYRRFVASQTCRLKPEQREQLEKLEQRLKEKAKAVAPPPPEAFAKVVDTKKLLNFKLDINSLTM
tara:strand:+ start:1227 stop:2024 length:798 start_codon:yes stop_codon:yes gene_type:complete